MITIFNIVHIANKTFYLGAEDEENFQYFHSSSSIRCWMRAAKRGEKETKADNKNQAITIKHAEGETKLDKPDEKSCCT